MELWVVDDEGVVEVACEEVEEYNLSKPMAQSSVCAEITRAIKRLKEE